MSWNTTRLDKADVAFSKYIRTKANWRCTRCGRHATGQGMHAAHFHGRRKESVRFSELNVDALCAGCHRHFTHNYSEHKSWKLNQLGQKQYDQLAIAANTPGKKQRDLEYRYWKEKLKELENE